MAGSVDTQEKRTHDNRRKGKTRQGLANEGKAKDRQSIHRVSSHDPGTMPHLAQVDRHQPYAYRHERHADHRPSEFGQSERQQRKKHVKLFLNSQRPCVKERLEFSSPVKIAGVHPKEDI